MVQIPRVSPTAVSLPASVAVGVGVGGAVGGALEPRLRSIQNTAWRRFLSMPLQAIEAAQLVASGEWEMSVGKEEAKNVGIDGKRFEGLVDMIDTAPDLSLLFDAWRRGIISEAQFRKGAKRHNIEDEWLDTLVQLRQRPLSAAESAAAWQQGYMGETAAQDEAALSGVNPTRSQIQRELAGLPPGPEAALAMLRRGIIDEGEFGQMIREGNTKTKYTDEYLETRWRILNATDAAGLWLRGWLTEGQAKEIGADNGYDGAAMDLLYKNRGRPATVRQAHIGFARGGRLPGFGDDEKATLRRSVEQSNIRTEWFDILYAQRFTYPSAFVLRALASDGTFDGPTTRQILIESGWKPEWAQLAADKWTGGAAGVSAKWLDRARSRLFTVAHDEYLDGSIDADQARSLLGRIGAPAGEQAAIITVWDAEQGVSRLELTPAQIRKAYKKGLYTEAQALAELDERGMTSDDADTFLQSG